MNTAVYDLTHVYRTEIASFVVGYALAELLWLRFARGREPRRGQLFANVFIYVVDTTLRLATLPARLALFVLVYDLSPLRVTSTLGATLACYVGVDFILYWYHRALHHNELGWALHSVHHTGRDYSLSLGVRLSWLLRAFDDAVYLPLVALGFEPLLVLAMAELNRFSQFWLHTEMIGKLPWLDPWLNTPANHRVHHAATSGTVRANYGSNFVLWDQLFGTYQREQGPVQYGTDAPDPGNNPFAIQLAGLVEYLRRRAGRWSR